MIKRIVTKRMIGMLSILLAFIIALNVVTPAMSESIKEAFSFLSQDDSKQDYTVTDEDVKLTGNTSEQKEVAYEDGKILIYNYSQLTMIGSGESYTYEDGKTATYAANASYKIAKDILLPRHTLWQLPEDFKGKIVGDEQEDAPLFDQQNDRIYLYNPYQLAVMAMDDADSQPVMSGDNDTASFGSGKVICTDKEGKHYLTYSDDHNYVISTAFTSVVSKKPDSVINSKKTDQKADIAQTGAEADTASTGVISDGRDFVGQVIKKIGNETYILIGNAAQLRAIGTDTEVYSAVYQTHFSGTHHVVDTDNNGHPIQLYGGDADLEESQNGYADFNFHEIHDKKHEWTTHYFAGVNQNTGEVYTDTTHVALETSSLTEASWKTGEKYTTNSNYIIFRDIDLDSSSNNPWTPLMFTGNMYGIKSVNGSALWNGSAIGDATALSARTTTNRPVISNVYVNNTSPINVDEFIGIGFFATITNEINVADVGVSSGTVHVENIELSNVAVTNTATTTADTDTLVSTITSGLGWIVGGVLDLLTTVLSIGSMHLTLRDTLSRLLDARADDPTVFATGAFAGRVVGDVEITNCAVTDSVTVQNAKDRTGGFIGYSEGVTQYDGLSQALGITSDTLSSLLNVIPGLGLGDLITVLLDNALPVGDLIVTGYIAPKIDSCEVNGLTGDVGTTTTMMAGGFIGQQIGTHISDSHVTEGTYHVKAHNYAGGFCGIERDAEIIGTLDGLGIDFSSIVQSIHPQSVLVDCTIEDSEYQVSGTDCIGGFVGAMTSSYAVDCTIDCDEEDITIHGAGEYVGGFAGFASVGWQSNLGKDENTSASLLGTVKELAIGLLDSGDKSAGQNLLTLMGVSPSAILGCQVYSSSLEVTADKGFVGGLVGKGEGIYLSISDDDAYEDIAEWNSGTLKETAHDRPIILTGLKSVSTENVSTGNEEPDNIFAGGIAGYMASAAFSGLLNDVVGLGDFIGFTVRDVTVTGYAGDPENDIDPGYTVKADGYDAGGGFGLAVGGTITNAKLYELKQVEAKNCAAGFVGISGPGDLAGTHGLTVNLLGLDRVLEASNLLSIGQGIEVHITDCDVNGVADGYTVDATGRNEGYEVDEFTAAGFIADSNSTKITDCHCYSLLSVTAADDYGCAGGFVGTSETGGLADVADNDATSIKKLIEANKLVRAIEYLLPEYTNCTTNFVDGGYVDADVAGGFAANFISGTVDNSTISTVDDAQNPKWTKTISELNDPDAVNATGALQKHFAVTNIDKVYGRTYAGGFGGKVISGALARAGGGLSILGNNDLGIELDITNLVSVINAYIPYVKHAGVYSENGFTVEAKTLREDDPNSGSAGGFGGFMSGAQITHCDVDRLKHTEVTPPADLEAVNAPSYYDSAQSAYAVTGGHYAGGYAGKIDVGSAASLGDGLKVLGNSIKLADAVSALSVVVSTVEHSDVQGAGGGFSVMASATDIMEDKVGKAGGFVGGIYGGHIQNSHCKNFYYIIGEIAAGGYVGTMIPGDVAKLLDEGSIFDKLIDVDSSLVSLGEDFVPSIRNSTTSCVPCGGAVRAQSPSDDEFQRGCAGGYCGMNDGGDIWGLNTSNWEDQNDGVNPITGEQTDDTKEGSYIGEQHIATAWRIRSVYGAEYAGGFTGYMKTADTAGTSGVSLLGGLIKANNVLKALSVVYPTEEHTAVYGPMRNIDDDTWSAWAQYVGKYGGYGAELARLPLSEVNKAKYIYGCNVVAGRSSNDETTVTEGGNAGGYVGYMVSGVITDGQSYDMKLIRAMRSAGGYAGKMLTGGAASFGTVEIIGLDLNVGQLAKAAEVFVPTIKSSSVHGWQSGMTVEAYGTDLTHKCGYAGGYVGAAYGAQIWGDECIGNYTPTGCNVTNLRYVRGANEAGGYVGMATAAAVADVNTNSSDGLLQAALDDLVSSPGDLASVLQATITTIRKATVSPDNSDFGFTVGGVGSSKPHFAGGFAGYLEAAVVGSRTGESDITVDGLRSVDGLYYAGGFVGLADVGGVASVSNTGDQTSTALGLIKVGSIDVLDVFRTYIYYADVNGVADGSVIRAYQSAPEGILSERRESGCAGGFGGGIMNGTVTYSDVTNLNTVYAPNYVGGFIGHMGKNGAVDVDEVDLPLLANLEAGAIDVFGTTVNECSVAGISAGAVIMGTSGAEPISGGFAGYADDAQIKNSDVTNLKQVYSDQIAGGFVGKTNMSFAVDAEIDSDLLAVVLTIVNVLVRALYVDEIENLNLIDYDTSLFGLRLFAEGDLLYVNLFGLRIGVSLEKGEGEGVTDTALITIGDSTVALPCDENGLTSDNPEVVVNLIKANRTRVDNCSVTGIDVGYDVYGGGASNTADGTNANGYAGGFVGYNNEGQFTSDRMVYCDVVRGTAQKVGTFSGISLINSVYSFNDLPSIEKVNGEENHYSVYRDTTLTKAVTSNNTAIATAGTDQDTNYKKFDITQLAAPITNDSSDSAYYQIFAKWNGAKLTDANGANATLLRVYVSNAKAVLMLDTPTYPNDESLIPNPGVNNDPCGNIDLTVQKIWNDSSDKNQSRPGEIQVRIWQHWENADGTPVVENNEDKVVLYTDANVISDVDTTDGWFTISKSAHGRADSATWTRTIKGLPVYTTINETTYYFSYTVEEAPILGYSSEVTYDETGSTTTATIVNTPEEFEIQFKYYDRYEINGAPSGIEDTETAYSVLMNAIPNKFISYDEQTHAVEAVDFAGLIGEAAEEFSETALSVTNVMCDYDLWTSQSAAAQAMSSRSYFVDGEAVSYGNDTTYHTDYLGKPNTRDDYSGQEASKNEKWVNYYDSEDTVLEENSLTTNNNYQKVKKIVVWCYNYPRLYNVDIYGADSADDLVQKTVGESTVYVANAIGEDNDVKLLNDHYYYNQRFGEAEDDDDQDDGGFIVNYGLDRYTGVKPADYAAETIDNYSFAYWAYDQEGTQVASVDRDFWYRVTNHTKLYAVYAAPGSTTPGISISANVNDTFVDESGVSRTRLNILSSVFGAEDYDPNVRKLSFVNISLSTQIRDNPNVYTPVKINALFEQYKDQLLDIIEEYDRKYSSKSFSTAHTYEGAIDENGQLDTNLQLTLTTKGYIYTVVSNENTAANGDATIELTNKNRAQFTMIYKTSALNVNNTGSNGDTCLMYCAALKYGEAESAEWSISTNCLIYRNGVAVRNTAANWN